MMSLKRQKHERHSFRSFGLGPTATDMRAHGYFEDFISAGKTAPQTYLFGFDLRCQGALGLGVGCVKSDALLCLKVMSIFAYEGGREGRFFFIVIISQNLFRTNCFLNQRFLVS